MFSAFPLLNVSPALRDLIVTFPFFSI